MAVFPLSEGSFTIDKTKIFVPFNEETDSLQDRSIGSLLVEVQPFCITIGNDIILIDTGLGFANKGVPQIHTNLENIGIKPQQVTKVLLSHLHKDHAGGVSIRNNFGHYQLSFPNAIYYVQQQEFENAMEIGYPSYMTDEIALLHNHPQVEWLNGNGSIDGCIHFEITGGHSQFHQVFWIDTPEKKLFFGGDDAPQLQQMKSKFVAKYDYNGKLCMELRNKWWAQGQQEGWQFLFYHDIATPSFG